MSHLRNANNIIKIFLDLRNQRSGAVVGEMLVCKSPGSILGIGNLLHFPFLIEKVSMTGEKFSKCR